MSITGSPSSYELIERLLELDLFPIRVIPESTVNSSVLLNLDTNAESGSPSDAIHTRPRSWVPLRVPDHSTILPDLWGAPASIAPLARLRKRQD